MDRDELATLCAQARDRIFGVGGTSAVSGCLSDPARTHLVHELAQLEQNLATALGLAETPADGSEEE